ncbi:MAG: hypothetical protein RhofKO_36000 [Rhodothermales bacterium]
MGVREDDEAWFAIKSGQYASLRPFGSGCTKCSGVCGVLFQHHKPGSDKAYPRDSHGYRNRLWRYAHHKTSAIAFAEVSGR